MNGFSLFLSFYRSLSLSGRQSQARERFDAGSGAFDAKIFRCALHRFICFFFLLLFDLQRKLATHKKRPTRYLLCAVSLFSCFEECDDAFPLFDRRHPVAYLNVLLTQNRNNAHLWRALLYEINRNAYANTKCKYWRAHRDVRCKMWIWQEDDDEEWHSLVLRLDVHATQRITNFNFFLVVFFLGLGHSRLYETVPRDKHTMAFSGFFFW